MLTRGDKNNRAYVGDTVQFANTISREMQSALFDPQTAGGLLISVPRERAAAMLAGVPNSVEIGSVYERGEHLIEVS
jgi:selenide, water dikinase